MEAWQERVVDEQSELVEKLDKLNAFIQTEAFSELSAEDQALLTQQAHFMNGYNEVLVARIERF